MHLQENTFFKPLALTLYPLHHEAYAPAKFEVATSSGLLEDTITKKRDRWTDRWTTLEQN